MKKLMIGFVGALAFVASAEVASSNIVGYKSAQSGALNNFVNVPFNTIGFNTAEVQQIKISDGGEGNIGWGDETFSIWQGLPTVVPGTSFFYYDPENDPEEDAEKRSTDYYWGDQYGVPVLFSMEGSQGVVLGLSDGLGLMYSGDVEKTNMVELTSIQGNNFVGNPFAQEIDIQAIAISDGGSGDIGWGDETFSVWEGLPTVVAGSSFFYYDPENDPETDPDKKATDYYWGDVYGSPVAYPIESGKGFVLSVAEGLKITIASPY